MTDDQRAEELKNQGNEEFKQGRYTQAVDLYSQAIGNHTFLLSTIVLTKNEAILTNRAASYIQLKKQTICSVTRLQVQRGTHGL